MFIHRILFSFSRFDQISLKYELIKTCECSKDLVPETCNNNGIWKCGKCECQENWFIFSNLGVEKIVLVTKDLLIMILLAKIIKLLFYAVEEEPAMNAGIVNVIPL